MIRTLASCIAAAALSIGCMSIGHNEQFRVGYTQPPLAQRDAIYREASGTLECRYVPKPDRGKDEVTSRIDLTPEDWKRCVFLPRYTLENRYKSLDNYYGDPDGEPIRAGDPVNVIINRVYIGDNEETLLGNAEIGVVVSAYDGSDEDGKDVLVAFERGIEDDVLLPINDLLAYSTPAYGNQAIRVTVTIFEFDQQENELLSAVLATAAEVGSAASPSASPAIGIASQIGQLLIRTNTDDVIAKMTFQVYPWRDGVADADHRDIGVPRIASGSYIVVNTKDPLVQSGFEDFQEERRVFLDGDLEPRLVERSGGVAIGKDAPNELWAKTESLDLSYVVLTIDKSPVKGGAGLLSNINRVNRAAAALAENSDLDAGRAALLQDGLKHVQSGLALYRAVAMQQEKKRDADSMDGLWAVQSELEPNELDGLRTAIRGRLPASLRSDERCTDVLSDPCKSAFDKLNAKGELRYDSRCDRYLTQPEESCHAPEEDRESGGRGEESVPPAPETGA